MQQLPNIPDPIAKVGDGVTWGVGSDRYPGTITRVSKSGKTFYFKQDDVKGISGSFQTGDWKGEYSPNPAAAEQVARWTVRNGEGAWRHDKRIIGVGHREYYQDPHF